MDQDGLAFGRAAALKLVHPDGEEGFRYRRRLDHVEAGRDRQSVSVTT